MQVDLEPLSVKFEITPKIFVRSIHPLSRSLSLASKKWHQEFWFIPCYVKHLLERWLPDLKGLTIELQFSTVKTMAIGRIVCVFTLMPLIGTSGQQLSMVPFRSP